MASVCGETKIETIAFQTMNDFELKSALKSVRVPEQPPGYWDDFPSRVRLQLRPVFAVQPERKTFLPRLAVAGGIAFVCVVMSLSAWTVDLVLKNQMAMRNDLVQSTGNLRALMAGDHGLHYLIVEKE